MAKEKKELIVGVNGDLSDNFTTPQKAVLGLQNTLAMCGVILVPILCGLDVSVTLFCAGIGTIIYQFIDKKMVPAFLGGSFAIIAGVSTVLSGCLGGPSLTIHSENTGVLAVTHLYSPTIVRFGALWMALLAFCPKFNALCGSIPQAVLGGVGILLYGMVTSTGIRTLVDHHVDFSQPRNLCIAAAILILGVGGAAISFGSITLSGMAFAAIAGIILHFVLPGREKI